MTALMATCTRQRILQEHRLCQQLGHDALTQWWEPEASSPRCSAPPSRQIGTGETNAGNRYKAARRQSPELCRSTPTSLDLEYSMKQHVALTVHLHKDDPKRFKLREEVSRRCGAGRWR